MTFKLNRIFKYLKKEHFIQLNNNCIKIIETFNRADLYFPMRKDLISNYNILNKSNNTVIYFDFKNKTLH